MARACLRFITFIVVFSLATLTYSMQHYSELWTSATIIGSLSSNTHFKYYFESGIHFIDDTYKLHSVIILPGLGYAMNPDLALFVGPGWSLTKSPTQGNVTHEYQLWEQINWCIPSANYINIQSRTWLEEKIKSTAAGMAVRFRERVWVRIPFKYWPDYFFSTYDEVFFNINHPEWVSIDTFSENRAFIGIGTHLSKSTMLDIGYLNQYILASKYQDNNVLLIKFTVNT